MQAAASSIDHSLGQTDRTSSWDGVFALSLGAFALIASEFMPVSLLTPIAADLGITEGQAGQGISVSGFFAVLTALFISSVAGRLDRKLLLLVLTGLMIVSGAIVAFAPTYETFMAGRALLGISIGGFWSLSAAAAMRLVKKEDVPRALAIFQGGNALATVIAAPLGSFLGGLIGWRGAFFCVAPIAVMVLVWQMVSLPSMTVESRTRPGDIFRLFRRTVVALGMIAASLAFMGHFALFTYLRPYLEVVAHVDVTTLSALLLLMGISGFVGTMIVGGFLKKGFERTLIAIPVLMAVVAVILALSGGNLVEIAVLMAIWGILGAASPVAWWTWVARTMPNDAEAGGGLLVAVVQFAITAGAVVGGILFDNSGYQATFGAGALLLLIAGGLALLTTRRAEPAAGRRMTG
ncbi:MAG: MFS transporter [Stutzerimonas stutzeri]|nr:MAG: MFS transporter [Stutzerimonas stutzeri]